MPDSNSLALTEKQLTPIFHGMLMGLGQGGVMANVRAHALTRSTCAGLRPVAAHAGSSRRLRILSGYTLAGSVSVAMWGMFYWLVSAVIG